MQIKTGRYFFTKLDLELFDNCVVYTMNPTDRSALNPGSWLTSALRDLECVLANRVANAAIQKAMQ